MLLMVRTFSAEYSFYSPNWPIYQVTESITMFLGFSSYACFMGKIILCSVQHLQVSEWDSIYTHMVERISNAEVEDGSL